ncbi:MAG: hypothetical protein RL385_3270 [Pseudomonadota bacterium]
MSLTAAAQLRLLWLSSPALPIGAYAYSRGLEQAIHAGAVHDGDSCYTWVRALLERQVASLDGPCLVRLHAAFEARDDAAVAYWCGELRAFRETAELALEDEQLGLALARLLRSLGELRDPAPVATRSYVAMLAYATAQYTIPVSSAVQLLFFTTAEAQITVASKSVPLGQSDAQRVLTKLLTDIPALVSAALCVADDALGAYLPGLALASALHETQYSRLYRS